MLKVDDKQKEVQALEIKACRRINMHVEQGLCLNLSLIHIVGRYLNECQKLQWGVLGLGKMKIKKNKSGKSIEIHP